MYDIHCHILPGLDDGAFSIDESLLMAESAAENGTRIICCTPHSGSYSRDELIRTFRMFKAAAEQKGIGVRLFLGQEIYLTENYRRQIRDIEEGYPVTVNRSAYPLVEFSPYEKTEVVYNALDELISRGFVPVVAHPERYAFITEDYDTAERIKKMGALLQINKGSLKGAFGIAAERCANYLLRRRMADFAASDAHSPFVRTPRLRDVHAYISEQYSMDYADWLMRINPQKMIRSEKIHPYYE